MAPRRSVLDDQGKEALAVAGRRPGWGCARRSGPESARQEGRKASASQAAEAADPRASCDDHGQAGELQRRERRGDALGRASEAQRFKQQSGEFAPRRNCMTGPVDKRGEKRGRALRARGEAGMIARMRASRLSAAPAMKSDVEVEADCTPEHGQIGRAPPVTAVNGPARTSAIRAATAGPRTLRGDRKKVRVLARDLFDAAARHRTELVHAPFRARRTLPISCARPAGSRPGARSASTFAVLDQNGIAEKEPHIRAGLVRLSQDGDLTLFSAVPQEITWSSIVPTSFSWRGSGLNWLKFSKSVNSDSITCARTSATISSAITSRSCSTARAPPMLP